MLCMFPGRPAHLVLWCSCDPRCCSANRSVPRSTQSQGFLFTAVHSCCCLRRDFHLLFHFLSMMRCTSSLFATPLWPSAGNSDLPLQRLTTDLSIPLIFTDVPQAREDDAAGTRYPLPTTNSATLLPKWCLCQ